MLILFTLSLNINRSNELLRRLSIFIPTRQMPVISEEQSSLQKQAHELFISKEPESPLSLAPIATSEGSSSPRSISSSGSAQTIKGAAKAKQAEAMTDFLLSATSLNGTDGLSAKLSPLGKPRRKTETTEQDSKDSEKVVLDSVKNLSHSSGKIFVPFVYRDR